MTSGYGRTIPAVAAAAQSAAVAHQGMAAYKTNQPGLLFAQQQAQQQQAVKDAKRLLFQMPSVRGGSAKPTPQEQAVLETVEGPHDTPEIIKIAEQGKAGLLPAHLQSVFDEAILNDSSPIAAAMKVQSFSIRSSPVDMPQPEMDQPKKISPMTYAIGAAALLLGGLYFLRN
jgi:hypothetical protein